MEELKEVSISLSDGYTFKAHVNGNNYLPEEEITDEKLTDEKLSKMTIDGVEYKNMHCTNHFKDGDGDHIVFRQITDAELSMKALEQAVQDLILAQMGGK